MPLRRITARDVARRAGVSQTTVSLVLNNIPGARISEETRQRVWQAVNELNYHPNATAQSLRRRATHVIGIMIPDSRNPHFWQIAHGAEQRAVEAGYSLLLTSTNLDAAQERRALAALKHQRVDGQILMIRFPEKTLPEVEAMRAAGHSIVRIGGFSPGLDSVVPDYGTGCIQLMTHLVAQGHRRIGFVLGVDAKSDGQIPRTLGRDRLEAYQHVVATSGLDDDAELVQFYDGLGLEDVAAATWRLLALHPRPTAILAICDYVAIVMHKTIVDAGLRVPQDISLASFDDIPLAQYLSPSLTTVRANADLLGKKAVELLLTRLQDPALPPQHILVPTELVIRQSTGGVLVPEGLASRKS